jgi:hypothetical protein
MKFENSLLLSQESACGLLPELFFCNKNYCSHFYNFCVINFASVDLYQKGNDWTWRPVIYAKQQTKFLLKYV